MNAIEEAVLRDLVARARLGDPSAARRKRPLQPKRTHCSRCKRPFIDPATRGQLPERAWCRVCEAIRRRDAPSRRKAAA